MFLLFFNILNANELDHAIKNSDSNLIKKLCANGYNFNTLSDNKSPIEVAVHQGKGKILEQLLECDSYLNKNKAVYIALYNDDPIATKLLLDVGTSLPISLKISSYGLIYDLLLSRRYEVLKLLLSQGMKSKSSGKGVKAKTKIANDPKRLKTFNINSIFFLRWRLMSFLP